MELLEKSEFTLDLSTWRCGGLSTGPDTAAGIGWTELWNSSGFMCCLGQFLKQLGVPKENLYEFSTPENVEGLPQNPFTVSGRNSQLSKTLMEINDSNAIPISDKIQQIKTTLEEFGYSLVVTGEPTEPMVTQSILRGN